MRRSKEPPVTEGLSRRTFVLVAISSGFGCAHTENRPAPSGNLVNNRRPSMRPVSWFSGACDFCGTQAQMVVGRPPAPARICSDCVNVAVDNIRDSGFNLPELAQEVERVRSGKVSAFCCSFCGFDQSDVSTLVAAPPRYVCEACVADALDLTAAPRGS